MKPVEIYKVHHDGIVLVSPSWSQMNLSTTHKYKPVNNETNKLTYMWNDVKIITRLI